jgi:uncharacterized protein YndB with AHSA1/START domain
MIGWVLVSLGALGAAIGVAILIGWWLPVEHRATGQIEIDAPPERIWAAMTDVEAFPAWRADVARVERISDAGTVGWVEHGRHGRLTFVVERSEPPRVLVTRIADRTLPFGGTWTYEIAPTGRGAVVTIIEHGEIYNPLFRFMSRFVFGYDGTMRAYLSALAARVGGTAAAAAPPTGRT